MQHVSSGYVRPLSLLSDLLGIPLNELAEGQMAKWLRYCRVRHTLSLLSVPKVLGQDLYH